MFNYRDTNGISLVAELQSRLSLRQASPIPPPPSDKSPDRTRRSYASIPTDYQQCVTNSWQKSSDLTYSHVNIEKLSNVNKNSFYSDKSFEYSQVNKESKLSNLESTHYYNYIENRNGASLPKPLSPERVLPDVSKSSNQLSRQSSSSSQLSVNSIRSNFNPELFPTSPIPFSDVGSTSRTSINSQIPASSSPVSLANIPPLIPQQVRLNYSSIGSGGLSSEAIQIHNQMVSDARKAAASEVSRIRHQYDSVDGEHYQQALSVSLRFYLLYIFFF